jgi:hypothetical protein
MVKISTIKTAQTIATAIGCKKRLLDIGERCCQMTLLCVFM